MHKSSFLRTVDASKKQPKLALIPYFCYSVASLKNTDNNKVRTLLHQRISPRAGEKGSNRLSSRLTAPLTAAFVGATIMLSAPNALANDDVNNAPVQTASMSLNPTSEALIGSEVTRKEAFRASTTQIVYHIGDGIEGVEANILSSKNDHYPIIAFKGGEAGKVDCFVGRRRCGSYTQSDVIDGTLSGISELAYDERFGKPNTSTNIGLVALNP